MTVDKLTKGSLATVYPSKPNDFLPRPLIIPGTGDFLAKYPWHTNLSDRQLDALERAIDFLGEARKGLETIEVSEKFGEFIDDADALSYYEQTHDALLQSRFLEYELRYGDSDIINRAYRTLCGVLQLGKNTLPERNDIRVTSLLLKAIEQHLYVTA